MNKKEYVLFIFEGKKVEPIIFENIKKYFLYKKETNISQDIIISYGTVIYTLYKEFFIDDILDEDLDIVSMLKPKDDDDNFIKTKYVSEIYLFFDYDSHASNAKDEKVINMLELFNNENEKGKLFISYPMVESLLHIKTGIDFNKTVEMSQQEYKIIARENCNEELLHFNDYNENTWKYLIQQHSKKANFIVNNSFTFPNKIIEQLKIFNNQKLKYINIDEKVAVLSGFALFLLDYYEISKFKD